MAYLGKVLAKAIKRRTLPGWGQFSFPGSAQTASVSSAAWIPQTQLRGFASVAEPSPGPTDGTSNAASADWSAFDVEQPRKHRTPSRRPPGATQPGTRESDARDPALRTPAQWDPLSETTGRRTIHDYNLFLRQLSFRDGHKVLDVWDEMALDGVAPNFYTILLSIEAATKSRRMGDLMFFWREMRRRGMRPNDMLYSHLITCCCRCGEAKLGMKYFQEMKEKGMKIPVGTYLSLLSAFADSGSVEECKRWLAEMEAAGHAVDQVAYAAVINAFRHNQSYILKPSVEPEINALMELAKGAPMDRRDPHGDYAVGDPVQRSAIVAFAALGFHERVVELAGNLLQDGKPPTEDTCNMLGAVVASYLDDAIGFYRLYKGEGETFDVDGNSYNGMPDIKDIAGVAKPDSFWKAVDLTRRAFADDILVPHDKCFKLILVGTRLCRIGVEGAYDAAQEILDVVWAHPNYFVSVEWGSRMLREACEPGVPNLQLAHSLFNNMVAAKRVPLAPVMAIYANALRALEPGSADHQLEQVRKVQAVTMPVRLGVYDPRKRALPDSTWLAGRDAGTGV